MSADEREELQWVEAAQAGDGAAFSELFHRFHPMIHAFAYRLCWNASDADEVAQETFIKAARALGEFRGGSFRAWIYRIARRCAVDRNRAAGRASRLAGALTAEHPADEIVRAPDLAPVAEALQALAEKLREAIVLTVCEGLTHAAAAKVLDCAETTVSWRVFQAKRQLRKALGGPRR